MIATFIELIPGSGPSYPNHWLFLYKTKNPFLKRKKWFLAKMGSFKVFIVQNDEKNKFRSRLRAWINLILLTDPLTVTWFFQKLVKDFCQEEEFCFSQIEVWTVVVCQNILQNLRFELLFSVVGGAQERNWGYYWLPIFAFISPFHLWKRGGGSEVHHFRPVQSGTYHYDREITSDNNGGDRR